MEEICRPQTINIITGCIVDQQLRLKDVLYKLPDITSSVQLFRLWSIESIFGEIRVEKSRFPGWFGGRFEGFGPCLGVSHPTHPHLGKSPKKRFLFWGAPLNDHVKNYDDDHHHHQTEKPLKVLSVASLSWTASLQLSANHGINMVELIQWAMNRGEYKAKPIGSRIIAREKCEMSLIFQFSLDKLIVNLTLCTRNSFTSGQTWNTKSPGWRCLVCTCLGFLLGGNDCWNPPGLFWRCKYRTKVKAMKKIWLPGGGRSSTISFQLSQSPSCDQVSLRTPWKDHWVGLKNVGQCQQQC